ncbi:RNA polymerase sigma factor [Candidatus Sumerlaeota bacterium]|nr:RNA polymerase sigma factor [Candidatus Sumerlaeota bacterium]
MTASDDWIIDQYLQGNVGAFEALYDRYASRLLGFLIALGADRESAEDAAQKAWIRVIENLDRYEPRGAFRSWLFTLAHRLWVDERRSGWERRREELETAEGNGQSLEESVVSPLPDPRERTSQKEEAQLLAWAVTQLPQAMREIVLWRVDADLTFREIADRMGCPLGTVLWRMRQAERRLQTLLGSPGMESGEAQKSPHLSQIREDSENG